MPIRSYGLACMKLAMVCFAVCIREFPLYLASLAVMDSEMSMATMMSTPLAFLSLYVVLVCGLARAIAAAMMEKMRAVSLTAPSMSLGFVPRELMMDMDENVMLLGVPSFPFSMSSRGSVRRIRNHQG